MWCRHCQQDVPAIAQTSRSNPACSRCRRELRPASVPVATTSPYDGGIALEAMDDRAQSSGDRSPDQDPEERQRRIRRGLRPVYRLDLGIDTGADPARPASAPPPIVQPPLIQSQANRRKPASRSALGAALALLLTMGGALLAVGVSLLGWAAASANELSWHWGMTATISGEAALILGLTLMALRLWRNSRRLNVQLDGVDQQLSEIQYTAGRLAHARQSCSQAYYDHFGAAASPPLALANLRGQMEQLTARLNR